MPVNSVGGFHLRWRKLGENEATRRKIGRKKGGAIAALLTQRNIEEAAEAVLRLRVPQAEFSERSFVISSLSFAISAAAFSCSSLSGADASAPYAMFAPRRKNGRSRAAFRFIVLLPIGGGFVSDGSNLVPGGP